jgi:hypothetical protein
MGRAVSALRVFAFNLCFSGRAGYFQVAKPLPTLLDYVILFVLSMIAGFVWGYVMWFFFERSYTSLIKDSSPEQTENSS